jgi:hypothetical protein
MTIKNDVATLVRLYTNHFRAHRNFNTYTGTHPNNNLSQGVGLQRRNNITTTEQALRRAAANIMRRHNIRTNRRNGGNFSGQPVTVYIPQLLRRLRFKHVMQEAGIPNSLINAYIQSVN